MAIEEKKSEREAPCTAELEDTREDTKPFSRSIGQLITMVTERGKASKSTPTRPIVTPHPSALDLYSLALLP